HTRKRGAHLGDEILRGKPAAETSKRHRFVGDAVAQPRALRRFDGQLLAHAADALEIREARGRLRGVKRERLLRPRVVVHPYASSRESFRRSRATRRLWIRGPCFEPNKNMARASSAMPPRSSVGSAASCPRPAPP